MTTRKIMRHIGGPTAIVVTLVAASPVLGWAEDLNDRIERMEHELHELKQQLKDEQAARQKQQADAQAAEAAKAAQAAKAAEAAKTAEVEKSSESLTRELLDRVKVGGYGSFRFEGSTLDEVKNTFTFRRFVLTTDANIAPRLRAYFEVEFERFRKLELEKSLSVQDGGLTSSSSVEGTDDSELSLEQGWLQYDLADWARFRAGAILVPVGRFNIRHDDNLWDLPRRSLVDRGVPVLPVEAAWDELGAGFNGDIPLSDTWLASYQLYVMNGVTLDANSEQLAQARVGDTTLIENEVEVKPSNGTFNLDTKDSKALSGRFAVSPSLKGEIAASFYWGRYTPDFLPSEHLYSISGDGRWDFGIVEVEGEYVFTHFGGIEDAARGFAQHAIFKESELENDAVEHEVDFELANLATDKQGYWIELRHRFWPAFLNRTVLGSPFQHPQMVAVVRGEQVWLGDLITNVDFRNGVLTALDHENRSLDRITVGLAYRPVPQVVFQLAYEYTRTDSGKSLSSVTNFLPAGSTDNESHAVLVGTAFGF
ncbi:MAG TPA: hypothetical protein VMW17_01465 [Candidatus Binatia bacterium]|nr:hypothetical protein [Candidatus Binatia bacterium]